MLTQLQTEKSCGTRSNTSTDFCRTTTTPSIVQRHSSFRWGLPTAAASHAVSKTVCRQKVTLWPLSQAVELTVVSRETISRLSGPSICRSGEVSCTPSLFWAKLMQTLVAGFAVCMAMTWLICPWYLLGSVSLFSPCWVCELICFQASIFISFMAGASLLISLANRSYERRD